MCFLAKSSTLIPAENNPLGTYCWKKFKLVLNTKEKNNWQLKILSGIRRYLYATVKPDTRFPIFVEEKKKVKLEEDELGLVHEGYHAYMRQPNFYQFPDTYPETVVLEVPVYVECLMTGDIRINVEMEEVVSQGILFYSSYRTNYVYNNWMVTLEFVIKHILDHYKLEFKD